MSYNRCIKNKLKGVYDPYDKPIEYTVQCNECRKYKYWYIDEIILKLNNGKHIEISPKSDWGITWLILNAQPSWMKSGVTNLRIFL